MNELSLQVQTYEANYRIEQLRAEAFSVRALRALRAEKQEKAGGRREASVRTSSVTA